MPGRRDDDAIFESDSLPIHELICVAKIFVRTKYADFSSMTIGYRYIITAQYQRSKSTNQKTIARHYNAIFEIKNIRLIITIICDAKNIERTKYEQ